MDDLEKDLLLYETNNVNKTNKANKTNKINKVNKVKKTIITTNNISLINQIDPVDLIDPINNLEYIKKYISSNDSSIDNKKQKGEVFTPYEIIIKMIDSLDSRYTNEHKKSIFGDKSLKWFDNSSGIGNFMSVVYYKLNLGLKSIIKGDEERKTHILENMIYMSELTKSNGDKCEKYFNPDGKYKLNINCGDSLSLDIKKTWKIDNVDIIIGNPPYQKQNKANNSARGGTNNNLYINFIDKSLEDIKENGYLVYIHPQNWRKIGNNTLNKFLEYQLEFLGLNYGGKLFKNVSVNTDFYVLHKKPNDNKFLSVCECYDKKNSLIMTNTFKINKVDFIPKYYSPEIQSILTKVITWGEQRNCILNSYCHKVRDHVVHKDNVNNANNANNTIKYIYPLFNTSGNPYDYFSSKKHIDQDKNKVIMSCSGKLCPIYDNGKYGTTQDSMYFIVTTDYEGVQLVNILNSSLYTFLIKICQWGNFRNEQKIFSYFKYPEIIMNDLNKIIDNDYINKYYKLTENEIELINM